MDDVSELKKRLVTACRILDSEGVMDELGHFSVRCPEKDGIYINGKVSPGQAREEDIILLDLEGNKLEGDLEPASESPLHLAVYQKRPDVMSIAHTHSPMVVTLSIAGVPLRTVENQGACVIGKEAPVFEKYGLVDSFDLGYEVAERLGEKKICVLKSHGNIVVGSSIEETCVFALWAEKSARYQYQALLLGEPHWYPENELGKMMQQMVKGKGHVRTWNYYKWKIENKP
ncbi:MAG: class II aldolase/adducin family protein [Deltaproteobacteria bacterium]|nr:class II aldolase/adducin family protein [Deltaproteobacteria bacterium]